MPSHGHGARQTACCEFAGGVIMAAGPRRNVGASGPTEMRQMNGFIGPAPRPAAAARPLPTLFATLRPHLLRRWLGLPAWSAVNPPCVARDSAQTLRLISADPFCSGPRDPFLFSTWRSPCHEDARSARGAPRLRFNSTFRPARTQGTHSSRSSSVPSDAPPPLERLEDALSRAGQTFDAIEDTFDVTYGRTLFSEASIP
jgi:hypothetical protein